MRVRSRAAVELGDVVAKGPTPELPRVFALPARSPETEVLQIGLRSVFTNQGLYIYEPKERAFWPHLTVARVRTADHKSRRPEAVHDPPSRPIPPSLRGPFEGRSVGLYRSEMRPSGARYLLLGKAELPGSTFATLHAGGR
jgi:2'-5' RNA ligase